MQLRKIHAGSLFCLLNRHCTQLNLEHVRKINSTLNIVNIISIIYSFGNVRRFILQNFGSFKGDI